MLMTRTLSLKPSTPGFRQHRPQTIRSICTPSRVSILLSQFERKHGVNFNSGTSVSPEAWAKSYPVVMREHGYYTGYIGKNHAPIGEGGYEGLIASVFLDAPPEGHSTWAALILEAERPPLPNPVAVE